MNTLYYGDNLDVLRRYIRDESVDLVYLDPPFKSNQDYNVLFAEKSGAKSAAQIKIFEDTWEWSLEAAAAYEGIVEHGGRVAEAMRAFRVFLGDSDMTAYLAMMAPRLVELRRALRGHGSLYLHCDSAASHYLKMLLDSIFGPEHFQNEIIWKRTTAHSDITQGATHVGRIHDVLLYYSKAGTPRFNPQWAPYDETYVNTHYRYVEEGTGRRYRKGDLTANRPGGDTSYAWRGVRPYKGRYWAYSKEKMEEFEAQGRLVYTRSGMPEYKRYLDEMPGRPLQDVWDDISPINSQAQERLGYPTQKPEALLERVIKLSSNEGDVVLDPFCGCGTAVAVAHRLNRQWVGIDVTHLAIGLIRHRLHDAFGSQVAETYRVIGEPVSLPDAEALATQDKYQFQWWALGLVGARPTEQKKGADKGIDGRLYFHDEPGSKTKQIVLSVKGGDLKAQDVRDLRGVIEREKAEIGVLLTLEEPTKAMRAEAASAGFYKQPVVAEGGQQYPRLQILTIGDLLAGQRIKYPSVGYLNVTFKKAPKVTLAQSTDQPDLPLTTAAESQARYQKRRRTGADFRNRRRGGVKG